MTNDELVVRVVQRLPNPNQIDALDTSHVGQIRFNWQKSRYRVDENLHVEEVADGMLTSTKATTLMEELLRGRDAR